MDRTETRSMCFQLLPGLFLDPDPVEIRSLQRKRKEAKESKRNISRTTSSFAWWDHLEFLPKWVCFLGGPQTSCGFLLFPFRATTRGDNLKKDTPKNDFVLSMQKWACLKFRPSCELLCDLLLCDSGHLKKCPKQVRCVEGTQETHHFGGVRAILGMPHFDTKRMDLDSIYSGAFVALSHKTQLSNAGSPLPGRKDMYPAMPLSCRQP